MRSFCRHVIVVWIWTARKSHRQTDMATPPPSPCLLDPLQSEPHTADAASCSRGRRCQALHRPAAAALQFNNYSVRPATARPFGQQWPPFPSVRLILARRPTTDSQGHLLLSAGELSHGRTTGRTDGRKHTHAQQSSSSSLQACSSRRSGRSDAPPCSPAGRPALSR